MNSEGKNETKTPAGIKEHSTGIKKSKLLLVEGKDEENFFKFLLENKGIEDIQIKGIGGKDQFRNLFKEIKRTPDFDDLKSLAVIHDADNNVQGSFQRICKVLEDNGLQSPKELSSFTSNSLKIGVFIVPDNKSKGNLESLCLSTVESKDIIPCVDSFMNCIKEPSHKDYRFPKNIHKARCRAFLSAMEQDTASLGIAACKGYWNFNSEKLQPLVNFLKQL